MTRTSTGRSLVASLAASMLLLSAVAISGVAQDGDEVHPAVGRWTVESEVGGSVWAFQPSGALISTGPGDILSEGTWSPAAGTDELDATLDVQASGQQLDILAQVAPDGHAIALYITATEATRPDDWYPWPAESRLVGQRFGMMVEETPEPSQPPVDCLRPQWVDGEVDWDRCDEAAPDS
jgi:hypothetical protein